MARRETLRCECYAPIRMGNACVACMRHLGSLYYERFVALMVIQSKGRSRHEQPRQPRPRPNRKQKRR